MRPLFHAVTVGDRVWWEGATYLVTATRSDRCVLAAYGEPTAMVIVLMSQLRWVPEWRGWHLSVSLSRPTTPEGQ